METKSDPSALEALEAGLALARKAVLRPPPTIDLPTWADRYRHLSTSSGAVGGRWRTSRVEVARGPMMAVTEKGVRRITVMTCTQLLKTSLLENVIGYYMHLDPCPMLLTEPKDESVEAFSKERLVPMVRSSPELAKLMKETRTRVSSDTLRFKSFPGGFLALGSAGSPSNLAMRAIRVVLLDEIDKYESTKEGDPIRLAEERTSTFTTSALSIRACSPTWEETSRIYRSYREGDMRVPYTDCPHCGTWIALDFFKHVQWEKTDEGEHIAETAAIYCDACGAQWSEAERLRAVTNEGRIQHRQTRPFFCCGERQEPEKEQLWHWDEAAHCGYALCKHCARRAVSNEHASFTASKMHSPFTTVLDLVRNWLESKDDPETKQTFYNTQLGRPFRANASKEVSHHYLAQRREHYESAVPEGVLVLTCGIDVQSGGAANTGRLELEVVGWGFGEESWSIDAPVFQGNPAKPEVWAELDEYLKRPFRHASGLDMHIMATCIDSGGHSTQDVYSFARARIHRNVWAIKGAADRGNSWSPVWPALAKENNKRQKFRAGYKPIIIGVNSAKEAIRQRLLVDEVGPGYCHFPEDRPEVWFEQLTSENLMIERRAGYSVRKWVKIPGRANEAIDCRAYAYTALVGLYHTRRFKFEAQALALEQFKAFKTEDAKQPVKRKTRPKVRRSNWMDG